MIHKIGATNAIYPFEPYLSKTKVAAEQPEEITDKVEISTLAVLRGKYSDMPEVRGELVAGIRDQIRAGTYETPEKWDQAMDNLIEDLQ